MTFYDNTIEIDENVKYEFVLVGKGIDNPEFSQSIQ